MCDPDLLARPPLRPLGRHEIEAWLRGWWRLNLDEVVDHEAGCPEQSDPVPVREMKLDAPVRFELHAVPCKVVANEAIADRASVDRRTRQQEGAAREEDGPQKPSLPSKRGGCDAGSGPRAGIGSGLANGFSSR